jgi:glutathione S-transferase
MMVTHWPSAAVTLLALLVYSWTMVAAGQARRRYGIVAPAVDGHPGFARAHRVQQNTIEQLVLFLPALWLCALTIGDPWAGLVGLVWPIGRLVYARAYLSDPDKRGPGFLLTVMPSIVLLLAAIAGTVRLALLSAS